MDGMFSGLVMPTIPIASSAPSRLQKDKGRPTFIILDSHIGYGSPHRQDTADAHASPLGEEEVRLTKRNYGMARDAKFLVPDGVYDHFAGGCGRTRRNDPSGMDEALRFIKATYPNLQRRSNKCSDANSRQGGIAKLTRVSRRLEGHGGARILGQGAERARARIFPGSSVARPIRAVE